MILLAVDIGGHKHSVALVRDTGEVLRKIRRPTERAGGRRWLLPRIESACREILADAPERPAAGGIGFGGPVDFERRRVRRSMHAGGWSDFPLAAHLAEVTGLRCTVDNDANVAALGEYAYGAGRGTRSMVYLTVSTGIGGGLLLNGALYRGRRNLAGEFGHTPLVVNGRPCACGLRGCVEAECSGTALGERAREAAKSAPQAWRSVVRAAGGISGLEARHVFDAARSGHAAARRLVLDYCGLLGRGLRGLAALLDPDIVVIGGGVSLAGPVLFTPLRRALAAQFPPYIRPPARCVPAALGDDSVLCGAARLALDAGRS